MQWEPRIQISSDAALNEKVASLHFAEQAKKYKDVVLINLIDKKKQQGVIGEAFTKIVEKVNNPKMSYTWFDYHAECKGMKFENIGKLVDEIKTKIESHDYFMA